MLKDSKDNGCFSSLFVLSFLSCNSVFVNVFILGDGPVVAERVPLLYSR